MPPKKAAGKSGKQIGKTGSASSIISETVPLTKVEKISGSDKVTLSDKFTGSGFGPNIFDCIGVLIFCPKDKNVVLTKISKNKGLWFPFVCAKPTDALYPTIVTKVRSVLTVGASLKDFLSFSPPQIIHALSIQLPGVAKFVTRTTFMSSLTFDPKHPTSCCQNTKNATWIPFDQVISRTNKEIWGPEPYVFVDALIANHIEKGSFTEYTLREAQRYFPKEPTKSYQDEMVKVAGFTEKDCNKIYSEYLQHAYPSQYLFPISFSTYFNRLGYNYDEEESLNLFRAFGFNHYGYLTFHEFLLGLAAMDRKTPHGGHSGEMRCGYIFRYYDFNSDNNLDPSEMFKLIQDIQKLKQKPIDNKTVEEEMSKTYNALGLNMSDMVNETQLLRGIGTMAFRGSSSLFRSPTPFVQQLLLRRVYDSIVEIDIGGSDLKGRRVRGTCNRCRIKKYKQALHNVRLTKEGTIIDPTATNQEDSSTMPKHKRVQSELCFSDSMYNMIQDKIREFFHVKKAKGNMWAPPEMLKHIYKLCQDAENIFKKESRCVKTCTPCFVLGDIHGNLHDLLIYETMLWPKGPVCSDTNYVFLGDYVDRGDHGIECAAYLFAMKVLSPEKFTLLRGNHELRSIQTAFTFQKECLEKFGKQNGQTVWDAFNKAFDCMPICAVIDDNIFCSHGGIPATIDRVDELINSIPCPLSDPESLSPSAWEILWNDPVSDSEYADYNEMLKTQSGNTRGRIGFLPNTKRGTAYYFSVEATTRFLTVNGFSHIIRGHEVIPTGYQLMMNGKVITVFSSSKYCGGINEAACIFIENEKIRILQLDCK